jgi:hypothetical protein
MSQMPAITDEQRTDLERKQLANALAKVNSGHVLSDRELAIVDAAHARSKATESAAPLSFLQTTELGFEVAVSAELERRGINDASRLIEQKPEVFRVIANLLSRQTPIRDICAICGVSASTVQSVGDHPEAKLPMVTQKGQLMAKMRLAVSLGIEALIERFGTGEVSALEWAIVKDKLTVDEGGVTDRTELVITEDPATREFLEMVRAARAAQAAGMVIDSEEVSTNPDGSPVRLISPNNNTIQNISILETARDSQSPEMTAETPKNVDLPSAT